jgi:hypothetical protein
VDRGAPQDLVNGAVRFPKCGLPPCAPLVRMEMVVLTDGRSELCRIGGTRGGSGMLAFPHLGPIYAPLAYRWAWGSGWAFRSVPEVAPAIALSSIKSPLILLLLGVARGGGIGRGWGVCYAFSNACTRQGHACRKNPLPPKGPQTAHDTPFNVFTGPVPHVEVRVSQAS